MELLNEIDESGNRDITIRVPKDGFGEFISSLLGQKRSIAQRIIDRKFIATQEWIINIINIIEQRLMQNNHELASFDGSVFFQNGRSDTVKTIEAFKAYSDHSIQESVGIYIRLSYLVYFPRKSGPEKQDIKLKVFSDSNAFYQARANLTTGKERSRTPLLEFEIEFTDLTFGEDVSRHLSSYLESACYPTSFFVRLLKLLSSPKFPLFAMLGTTLLLACL